MTDYQDIRNEIKRLELIHEETAKRCADLQAERNAVVKFLKEDMSNKDKVSVISNLLDIWGDRDD